MSPARRRGIRLIAAGLATTTALGLAISQAGTTQAAGVSAPDHGALDTGPKHLKGTSTTVPAHLQKGGAAKSVTKSYLLELDATPALTAFDRARTNGRSVKTAGAKAATARTVIKAAQDEVVSKLPRSTSVLYRIHNVLAGVAVTTDAADVDALKGIAGVKAIYPLVAKSPTNAYAIPLQGGGEAWDMRAGLDGQAGDGVRILDIDTGLDYTHADFGGPGTREAFDEATAASTGTPDPSLYDAAKFDATDSYDLVGDSYNADPEDASYQPVPQPDDNPLDCDTALGGGHGTHTAGTAAGYGVLADGSTYDGAYDADTIAKGDTDTWEIGPGMAPKATLLSIRVFGCSGSSNEVGHALDMAIDLNTDSDPANDVDVINMSLGSDYAPPNEADAVLSAEAVKAGINVVVASGNAGDVVDIGGSPGNTPEVLTAAASTDEQTIADGTAFSIDGGADEIAGSSLSISYHWGDPTAVGGGDLEGEAVLAGSDGCTPITSAAVAGKIAVLAPWTDDALECGSVVRGRNAREAGAVGFIFISTSPTFSAGITGDIGATDDPAIPGVLVRSVEGDEIVAALENGSTVDIHGTSEATKPFSIAGDDNKMADFSSRGVHGAGNVKPDVTAVGATVFSAKSGAGAGGVSESGTSMATPTLAGLAALVQGAHPDWSPEFVKADIMNTAGQDVTVGGEGEPGTPRYAPNRAGSGRIDAPASLENDVLAYNADDLGSVSLSFGPVEVPISENFASAKPFKVTNLSSETRTFDVAYDAIDEIPGVEYVLSADHLTLAPGQTQRVNVTLEIADPTLLTKAIDASQGVRDTDGMVIDPATGLPSETLADASGNVVLTPTGAAAETEPSLRVPVYSAPRPTSELTIPKRLSLDSMGAGTVTPLGTGVDQEGDAGDVSDDIFSLGAGFELQAASDRMPVCDTTTVADCLPYAEDAANDINYVGSTSDYPLSEDSSTSWVYFAVSSYGVHTTPWGPSEYDVYIDVDDDGASDFVAWTETLNYPNGTPVYVAHALNLWTGEEDINPLNGVLGNVDTAAFDSDVQVVPVWLSFLEDGPVPLEPGSPITYGVTSFSPLYGTNLDPVGVAFNASGTSDLRGGLTMNPYTPAVQVTEKGTGPLVDDQGDLPLDVAVDPAQYAADSGQGLLYLHYHNAVGSKAQVASLDIPAAEPSDPPAATATATATVTATVTETPTTTAPAVVKVQPAIALKAKKKVKKGKKVKVTVTITGASTPATGTVTVSLGAKSVDAQVSGGTATVTVKVKKKTEVSAVYLGDAGYLPGASPTITIRVKK